MPFIPPGIPLAAIIIGMVLQWILTRNPEVEIPSAQRYILAETIALSAIVMLGLWSVVLFRSAGQNENPWKPAPRKETRDPFRSDQG